MYEKMSFLFVQTRQTTREGSRSLIQKSMKQRAVQRDTLFKQECYFNIKRTMKHVDKFFQGQT